MRILKALSDLTLRSLSDAYIRWYKQRYTIEQGDLVTNTVTFWMKVPYVSSFLLYSTPGSIAIPPNTPMVCVGMSNASDADGYGYIIRINEIDVILYERNIVYIKIVSRYSRAKG